VPKFVRVYLEVLSVVGAAVGLFVEVVVVDVIISLLGVLYTSSQLLLTRTLDIYLTWPFCIYN